mmetsp:Transcript_11846/g.17663  ORF Transcript_11846/g.17663 Transcript_11846/m.17663 type:complete len:216 (-) Transcript_11846:46-693(-)
MGRKKSAVRHSKFRSYKFESSANNKPNQPNREILNEEKEIEESDGLQRIGERKENQKGEWIFNSIQSIVNDSRQERIPLYEDEVELEKVTKSLYGENFSDEAKNKTLSISEKALKMSKWDDDEEGKKFPYPEEFFSSPFNEERVRLAGPLRAISTLSKMEIISKSHQTYLNSLLFQKDQRMVDIANRYLSDEDIVLMMVDITKIAQRDLYSDLLA